MEIDIDRDSLSGALFAHVLCYPTPAKAAEPSDWDLLRYLMDENGGELTDEQLLVVLPRAVEYAISFHRGHRDNPDREVRLKAVMVMDRLMGFTARVLSEFLVRGGTI